MLWRKSQHPTTWDYPCFRACKLIARALPPSFLRLGASPLKGHRFSWGTAAFRSGGSRVRWNPSRFSSFCHRCRMQGQVAMWSWQPQETKRLVAKFTELWWLHPTLFVSHGKLPVRVPIRSQRLNPDLHDLQGPWNISLDWSLLMNSLTIQPDHMIPCCPSWIAPEQPGDELHLGGQWSLAATDAPRRCCGRFTTVESVDIGPTRWFFQ